MKNRNNIEKTPVSRDKKSKIIFFVLMVFFAMSSVGLSIWLSVSAKEEAESSTELENHYQQAYYELIGQTNDMEIKAAKLLVTSSRTTQVELLYDIWKGSEVSVNCLSALSAKDTSIVNATKFINQMGDYCLFLAKKVGEGDTLGEEEINSLTKIHEILVSLGQELAKIQSAITEGYLFMDNVGTENDMLSELFNTLNGDSIEYPQLIYDGPFSDSLSDKEVKYATGEALTSEQGEVVVRSMFTEQVIEIVEYKGEWDTDIDTLNYEVTLAGITEKVDVQITKAGGVPLSLSTYCEVSEPNLTEAESRELAVQYLDALGFGDMTPVWSSNVNSTVYINLAPEINGIILYPDLIKVKIATDTGRIVGLDTTNYCYNHTDRTLAAPAITVEQAKLKITDRAEVTGGRLVLIPKNEEEILCYEFSAFLSGDYLVYIDAATGEEANILFIIDAENGTLLM